MNIRDLLNNEKIIAELVSENKENVIKELATTLVSQEGGVDLDILLERLDEREKLSSTGIGDGIAIPHCKYKNISTVMMVFGRSIKGIDFDSIDKRPATLFFLLIAPDTPKAAGDHLRTLAKITRILKSDDFKKRLMEAKETEEIYRIIAEEDEKY